MKASREDKVKFALTAIGVSGQGAESRVTQANYSNFIRALMGVFMYSDHNAVHLCLFKPKMLLQDIVCRPMWPTPSRLRPSAKAHVRSNPWQPRPYRFTQPGGQTQYDHTLTGSRDRNAEPSMSLTEFAMQLSSLDFDSALTINF